MPSRPCVITPVTASGTSAQALGAQPRNYLLIANVSASNTIYVQFGTAAAVVNGAGTIEIAAGAFKEWQEGPDGGGFVPSDAIQIIASAASTAVTIIT